VIDIGGHPLAIGIPFDQAPLWADAIVGVGRRDAALVDTGYLRALLDPSDGYHEIASEHWNSSSLAPYTTPLVLGETVRQMAKYGGASQPWRIERVSEVRRIVVDRAEIIICGTTKELIHQALRAVDEMQHIIDKLDFCDCLSMTVLDALQHRRVLGFDSDFSTIGASLEP
jgi:predicted nucleic acid-binding protein